MKLLQETNFSFGKFLVSPLIRLTGPGAYRASVSIRSGQGRGTHDRVLRFADTFPTRESARRHAIEQGLNFVLPRVRATVAASPTIQGA